MTIFRSRLWWLLNIRNLQTQYQTQLFFRWCGSQTAWWLQLSLSVTSPGPWRRVSCKAHRPTSWGIYVAQSWWLQAHALWLMRPKRGPDQNRWFCCCWSIPCHPTGRTLVWVHSLSCWNGVVNPDTDYGPSIAIMTDVHIYIYIIYTADTHSFWEPHKRWMLIATKFCSTRIIHFKYGKCIKVEEAGCSISQCADLTMQRAQSSNVRVAILGRNSNGGTTCAEMKDFEIQDIYIYIYMAMFKKKICWSNCQVTHLLPECTASIDLQMVDLQTAYW